MKENEPIVKINTAHNRKTYFTPEGICNKPNQIQALPYKVGPFGSVLLQLLAQIIFNVEKLKKTKSTTPSSLI